MGLDAWVYCDCFEKGRLKTQPPAGTQPHLDPDGGLSFETPIDDLWFEFEEWIRDHACEHPGMKLVLHYLGNSSLIALIRQELSSRAAELPILFQKVIYSGIHAGDSLPAQLLPRLEKELAVLAHVKLSSERDQIFLNEFRTQMEELVRAAISVNKPICF